MLDTLSRPTLCCVASTISSRTPRWWCLNSFTSSRGLLKTIIIVIRGYFVGEVLGITVKLSVETIAQAISCKRRSTKFMNSWWNELKDHIGLKGLLVQCPQVPFVPLDGGHYLLSNTQVDDSILSELHQKFGLNTGQDDQLDAVWEKATKEEDRVDVDTSQAEKRTKKKMNANSSKVASAPQRPPPTLVAPKGTGVMAHVSKKETPKKP
ncbi:hypothetical protein GmHk_15G044595 [Glycine max]|nr:hypothetical protein GmHk_15G044595 [Glycine max]